MSDTPEPQQAELTQGRPKLVVELKELDDVYSRFFKIFILTNILTVFISTYVIAHILFPGKFETGVFKRFQTIGLCVLMAASLLLCLAQWLFMHHTTRSSRRKIEELTLKDALTNVYNYRFLDRRLDEELRIAHRFHTTLSVIYMDLDKFKAVNDNHGHQFGNAVLSNLGNYLKVSRRVTDMVGRMGGDEFLVILPNTSRDEAQIVCERIRAGLEQLCFAIDGQEVNGILSSLGVASYPYDASDKEGLIAAADQAMYRAKQSGGNRVCI